MQLRDLVRGGEPVRVSEKRGSEGLRQWDRIATRVVPLRDGAVISGALMLFEHQAGEAPLASLRKVRAKAPRDVAAAARGFGIRADAEALAGMPAPDLLLARAAFMFTNAWLDAALRSAQGRDRPELLISEGDPLEFTVLHFPLRPGVTAERVREALASVPALRPEGPAFWNWLAAPGAKPKAVPRRAKAQTVTTTMEDGAPVFGTLQLKGRRLSLEANSVARAERGRALLEPVLAGLVGRPSPNGPTSSGCWPPSARRRRRAACRRKTSARWSARAWTTTTGASSTSRYRPSAASRRGQRRRRRRGGRR